MAKGGFTGAVPPRETSPEEYSGVWNITEQYGEQKAGSWPFQEDDCALKSLRFNASDSGYLTKTPAVAGNRRTWTLSFWVKLTGDIGHLISAGNDLFQFELRSDGQYLIANSGCFSNTYSTAVFRDYSAWQHFVIEHDATNTYCKVYVNGSLQKTITATNADGAFNNNTAHNFSGRSTSLDGFTDFYLAEAHFVDGQALSCDEFGFFDSQGIWQPKRFAGDYSSGPVYSNFLTSSGTFDSANPPSGAFDGIADSSNRARGGTDDILTFDISSFGFTGLFEFWSQNNPAEFSIDGGSTWSAVSSQAWTTASSDITGVTSIKFRPDSGATMKVSAFRSQGQWLTDAAVGRNSFHLDFSQDERGEVKDQSGLGNYWTANSIEGPVKGLIAGVTINAPSNVTLQTAAVQNMFNGDKDNFTYAHTNDATNYIQWAPTGGYPTNGHIWIQGGDGNGAGANTMEVQINGSVVSRTAVVDNETYSQAGYGWGDWHKYPVAGNTLTSLRLTGAYALIRQLSTVDDPTHSVLGISNDNDVPAITDTLPSLTDYLVDSPVNGNEASTGAGGERRGNYATLNPLISTSATISNGNLDLATSANYQSAFAGFGLSSGKWYFEGTVNAFAADAMIGVGSSTQINTATFVGNFTDSICYAATYGRYWKDGTQSSDWGNTFGAGDTVSCAFDADSGKIWFAKNGVWQASGDPAAGTNPASTLTTGITYFPGFASGNTGTWSVNFGQKSFSYTPPAGFSPLATSFLPEPTIKRGDEAMDVVLYTGNNSTNKIGNLRLSPDLVWIKTRSPYALNHELYDTVRGAGNLLRSNTAGAEDSATRFSSFDSDGFTLNGSQPVNGLNETHVGWVWDAGDSTTTIAAGSLNSSAYNDSQTWSDDLTSSPANSLGSAAAVFDGSESFSRNTNMSAGATVTFTPTGTITNVTKLEVKCGANNTSNTVFELNGVNKLTDYNALVGTASGVTNRYVDITALLGGSTTLTSMKWGYNGSSNYNLIRNIKVNGALLVDSGVSVANVPLVATDVRARTDAGFSIAKWSKSANNQSYAHGLSQAPEFIIAKSLDGAHSWRVWHKDLSNNKNALLDTNQAEDTYTDMIGIPDAYKVPLIAGGPGATNGGMIAYNFHSIEGYCQIGSFVNPSSTEGAFVFCGFRPALIIGKCVKNISSSSGAGDWIIRDTTRSPFNNPSDGNTLIVNSSAAEDGSYTATQVALDILSNGFKIRHPNSSPLGDPGRLYIFAAWAENPFASNARAR